MATKLMNIITTIIALSTPVSLAPRATLIDTRSDKQKSFDEFFKSPRFGCNDDAVKELLDKIFGLKLTPIVPELPVPLFSIFIDEIVKIPAIILSLECKSGFPTGFCSLSHGIRLFDKSIERLATVEEAQDFLNEFSNMPVENFLNWVIKHKFKLPKELLEQL